jgi:hypothetical protein
MIRQVGDAHNLAFFLRDFVMNDVSNFEHYENPTNRGTKLGRRKGQQYHRPLEGRGKWRCAFSLPLCY